MIEQVRSTAAIVAVPLSSVFLSQRHTVPFSSAVHSAHVAVFCERYL